MKIIWDAPGFRLYSLRFEKNCFSAHSCNAQAQDSVRISNVFGFDGATFNGFISHYIIELSVEGMPGHGLCLAHSNGINEFCLVKPL
jgi:hypothetical protein